MCRHVCITAKATGKNEVADGCWSRPCKSAFMPSSTSFLLFVSFTRVSCFKRGSLIRDVSISTYHVCANICETQQTGKKKMKKRQGVISALGACVAFILSKYNPWASRSLCMSVWVFVVVRQRKRDQKFISKASLSLLNSE